MTSTPETDAAIKAQAQWRRPFISYTMDGITWDGPVADLCRRLERERDEARDRERIAALVHKALYDTVECERDEAIREMNRYKRQWEESRSENVEGAK